MQAGILCEVNISLLHPDYEGTVGERRGGKIRVLHVGTCERKVGADYLEHNMRES